MSSADRFQAVLEKLADDTAAQARRIANRRNITKADKVARLAGLLNRANAQAVALADVFTSRQLEDLTGTARPATGVLPADESDRLLRSARTALEDRDTALERVERLARSEPLATAQTTATEALSGQKHSRGDYLGWVRQLNVGACQLCAHWARGDRVWPADHWMPRHPDCKCVPRIVITPTKPRPVRKRRR